ncbi:sirohydrochlorin chelatase, partial [Halomonas sp.]|uniref:sirohydrochlorin chelatase n=1 Tax=Halomonas sp. TaxID=1486246 RepID=UPI003567C8B9
LRRLAAELSARSAVRVEPASLLHSNKVPAEDLEGVPAVTLGPAATRRADAGCDEILVLPFFFGSSRALTEYLPERMATLQQSHPGVHVRIANPLVDLEGPLDLRLARILRDGVLERMTPGSRPAVVLVDHGSPIPEVTAVRNVLAGQLGALLEDRVHCLAAASMERREGDAYRFNEPLLERLLDNPGFHRGEVIVSMLFLSPGRHAGRDGDVAVICAEAERRHPGLQTTMTRLAGEHDAILDILAERLDRALAGHDILHDIPPPTPRLD